MFFIVTLTSESVLHQLNNYSFANFTLGKAKLIMYKNIYLIFIIYVYSFVRTDSNDVDL